MICVVIPVYRCADTILDVLQRIGEDVGKIVVVDDACPEKTGKLVQERTSDDRIHVIFHEENRGVGGAVKTGMKAALELNASIVVKIDGDGQMPPELIPRFVKPIRDKRADYVKGNRFFNLEDLSGMPRIRLIGNAGLSLLSKASSGYWSVMDPTNGYIAMHAKIVELLPLEKISNGYFFESDLLFRLGTIRGKVFEVSMPSVYGSEHSSLSPAKSLVHFSGLHISRFLKRFFYNYVLRNFNAATLATVVGLASLMFGALFGASKWADSIASGIVATTGTVMIAILPIVLGAQLLLFAMQYDVSDEPKEPIHPYL